MEKVILITSRIIRERNNLFSKVQLSDLKKRKTGGIDDGNSGYLGPFIKEVFPCMIGLNPKEQTELEERATNATTVSELETLIKNEILPKIKNKGGGEFVFGLFKKNLKSSNVSVYYANEFPLGSFEKKPTDEQKYCYLNAIVNEIINNKNLINVNDVDWEIISHDKDWGKDEYLNCHLNDPANLTSTDPDKQRIKEYFKKIISKIDAETKLKEIVDNTSSRIQLFQHDANVDDAYLYIQKMMSEKDYEEDFTTFMEGTKENNKLFNAIGEAGDEEERQKKIEEFLNKVNPNYGIFPHL